MIASFFTRLASLLVRVLLAACSGGAVVFAPTPAPADASPATYTHPSGVFSINVPRQWPVYEQYTTNLASASFAPPDSSETVLTVSVIDLGQEIDSQTFGQLIEQYQTQVRPDIETYSEQNREALGDGSWRMTGLRLTPAGNTQQVNTFLQRDGSRFAVLDVVVPDDPALANQVEQTVNTLVIHSESTLTPADFSALAFVKPASLGFLHVATWTTPEGVFFITGEVANYGAVPVNNLPVEAGFLTADGLSAGGAVDTIMGYGIEPGGFAPFSLRFGSGQPSIAEDFMLRLGGDSWHNDPEAVIFGANALEWTDESSFNSDGNLTISGQITNVIAAPVYNLRVFVTVFDDQQRVIGAAWSEVTPQLLAGESANYNLILPELGGDPVNYIVGAQATD